MSNEGQKTKEVLKWFEEICKIPHGSTNEAKLREWLVDWANGHKFQSRVDDAGNLVIKVPGTKGFEKAPTVVLQGHLDMVCEKTPDSTHDFKKDPIKLKYEGDWLKADKTTLGADNGVAIAMMMALCSDQTSEHPPLELLFTVDEETGLIGASGMAGDLITGKILLNLDSEDEGYFTVGCAGGRDTTIMLPVDWEKMSANAALYTITTDGMHGGHSGVDINRGRANALQVLGRVLGEISRQTNPRVATVQGGSAHNAIPRNAAITLVLSDKDAATAKTIVSQMEKNINLQYHKADPELKISIAPASNAQVSEVMTESSTKKMIWFMQAMPHGVAAMSQDIKDLVETSTNFARLEIEDKKLKVVTSQRSSYEDRLKDQSCRVEALSFLANGTINPSNGYPPWPPDMESPLLKKCVLLYETMFSKKPVLDVIHAGLECGVIGSKYSNMDMVSFGPTIKDPHSPDERIQVSTIEKTWDFLLALLKTYKA